MNGYTGGGEWKNTERADVIITSMILSFYHIWNGSTQLIVSSLLSCLCLSSLDLLSKSTSLTLYASYCRTINGFKYYAISHDIVLRTGCEQRLGVRFRAPRVYRKRGS